MNQLKRIHIPLFCLVLLPIWAISNNSATYFATYQQEPQQTMLRGKVVDGTNGEAVPYCNIAVASSSFGTATNELGEFIVAVDSLPATLIFSHLNYGQQRLQVERNSPITLSLEPLTTVLEEVVVKASRKDALALDLAKKAFRKAKNDAGNDHFGRAFYRQKSRTGDQYTEFSEIFYDIRYSTDGISDWNIAEGRYALTDNTVFNRNYTLFSRILRPAQPDTEDLILPSHARFTQFYKPQITDIVRSDDATIAVVRFTPLKSVSTPAFEGDVFIDMNTFDIMKIRWSLARDDLDFVTLTSKNSSWKAYRIAYEIAYKKDSLQVPLLDYIKVDQAFDYYKNDLFQSKSTTSSILTFYEHYTPTSRKRLGRRMRMGQSDWKKLDDIGYNERFWADNPIVKRTPVEEEVIQSFEKEEAFNSIFLNSAENIALMSSNISEDPFIQELSNQLNLYANYNPTEKVYLHTDKNSVAPGDHLWYSAYAVIGPDHRYTTASRVLHVDLIGPDGQIIEAQTRELIGGRGSGSLQFPKDLAQGTYAIRAYTQWMRNYDPDFFFSQKIAVFDAVDSAVPTEIAEDRLDLQFFPEGGALVADIPAKVAFKAVGSDGLETKVKGQIVNAAAKTVAAFSTFDRGAGFFQLLPSQGETYFAVLEDGTRYQLPQVLDKGYGFRIDNLNEKSIRLNVQASASLVNEAFFIVAHMRQRKVYQARFEFGEKPTMRIEIPKSHMPSGVLTITLFDEHKKPWCERQVFVNNQEELVISTAIKPQKPARRNKIELQVTITDTDGVPVSTDFSLSATDADQVAKQKGAATMLTQLLLESDMKGHISDPGLLFKDQKRATLHALDLVMLTHGWRKFSWTDIWGSQNQKKQFDFAKGLLISGKASNMNNKPMGGASLNVVAKSGDVLGMLATKTRFDGSFIIPDFNFDAETELVFNAFNSNDRPVNVKVKLDTKKMSLPLTQFKSRPPTSSKETETYLSHTSSRSQMDALYASNAVTELDEVVVTEKKIEQGGAPSVYGQTPDATLYTADHSSALTVLDLTRRFSGVTVNGNTVSIRNRGTPLWVLDGVPVFNDNPNAVERAYQEAEPNEPISLTVEEMVTPAEAPTFITTMDTFAVERIELLKGPSAAIYGSRGGNGVILIYTKRGVGKTVEPVVSPDFTVLGHSAERAFYSPKYDRPLDEHETPDYRATLHWQPTLRTDENGKATIEFFNSDAAERIQISIEGLSSAGIPGSYLHTFGKLN